MRGIKVYLRLNRFSEWIDDRSPSMFFLKNCSIGLVKKFTFKGEHKTYN